MSNHTTTALEALVAKYTGEITANGHKGPPEEIDRVARRAVADIAAFAGLLCCLRTLSSVDVTGAQRGVTFVDTLVRTLGADPTDVRTIFDAAQEDTAAENLRTAILGGTPH